MAASGAPQRGRLARNVVALGFVSLLTDVSSEIVTPLLPFFLHSLGATPTFIGLVEGIADATASVVKGLAGWLSDRFGRRKALVVGGYGLAGLARPAMALAASPLAVLGIRFADRVGKGLRGAPRDALIADSTPPGELGRAFGFHRAMDHAGAMIGPLVAFALLGWIATEGEATARDLQTVFWAASVPAALSVLVLVLFVREIAPRRRDGAPPPRLTLAPFDGRFRRLLAVLVLFALGNSSDAFLVLRAAELGVETRWVLVLWALLHLVKSASSLPAGAWSDRAGRRRAIATGWVVHVSVYVGFALATETWHAWALFAAYGLSFGFTEGTEKALVADIVPQELRGTAYGVVGFAVGLAAFPASLLMGWIWSAVSSRAAFSVAAAIAALALALLPLTARRPRV